MKIAMLTNNYKPFIGGVPISIERLSNDLRSLGHKVTIFAPQYPGYMDEEEDVIRYRSFSFQLENGCIIPNFFDPLIEKKIKNGNFDLIHVHHPACVGYSGVKFGKKYGIPVVYTYHTRYEMYVHNLKFINKMDGFTLNMIKNKIIPNHNKIFTNHCDAVIAPTPYMKQCLEENGTTSPIHVMPTGLSEKSYLNKEDSPKAFHIRSQMLEKKECLFCTVSRLEKEKNIEFMLKSLRKRKDNNMSFQLMIIGDGSEKSNLQKLTLELGLNNDVTFVGNVPHEELKYYYGASDLFLFSSKSETQGMVLIEAMAAGTPVVAVKASGVRDIVYNGDNGFMTEEVDDVWGEQIESVMEDKLLLKRLSDGAKETADKFKGIEVAKQMEKVYKRTRIKDMKRAKYERKTSKVNSYSI